MGMRAVKIVHEFSKKVNGCFELAFSNRCQNVSNVSNYDDADVRNSDGPSFLAQNIKVFYDFRKSLISVRRTLGLNPGKKCPIFFKSDSLSKLSIKVATAA